MENKYVYHIKTQEEFDRYIGGRNSSGTDGGGWKVWAGSCLGVLAIPIIEYALGKGIDALGKLITDNNKTNSKLTEIEAKGKADCRKIETQGEVKCKIIDKETEGKCKIIKTQGEEKRQTMQKEHDLKKDFYDYKQAEKEKKQQQKQAKSSPGLDEWLQQYRQAVPQADTRLAEEYALIFPWLTEGYDIGLVAPTNCGKTTLMMQVAMDLTRGEYTHKLAPGCSKIQPVRVLYFALEQSQKDIDRHYGNIRNTLPMLTVYDGATWKTADMIEIIKREMMACRGRGVVVIIDNWTKLRKKKQASHSRHLLERLGRTANGKLTDHLPAHHNQSVPHEKGLQKRGGNPTGRLPGIWGRFGQYAEHTLPYQQQSRQGISRTRIPQTKRW